MTKEQIMVKTFMTKVGQECPTKPASPDLRTRKLRAKLMLEEVLETINDGLGLEVMCQTGLPEGTFPVSIQDAQFVSVKAVNLVELADGLADSLYVQLGTAVATGIDLDPVFEEVNSSNMSKFIDGYTDESGKYRKGPSFRPPDIKSVLGKQRS